MARRICSDNFPSIVRRSRFPMSYALPTNPMIVLNLQCAGGHRFDGWFASSEAFDTQLQRGLVACPMCTSDQVVRLPSGPRVLTHGGGAEASGVSANSMAATAGPVATASSGTGSPLDAPLAALLRAASEALSTAEDVAEQFPEEARKIHYGEAPVRGIRGHASVDEVKALLEEGVPVLPLPVSPKGQTH